MTNHQEVATALAARLPALPERDRDFASSLLSGFARYGRFTDRQFPHAQRLATFEAPEAFDVAPLFAMFKLAQSKMKRPTIRVRTEDGSDYTIRPAASTSRNAGSLYLYTGAKAYAGCIEPTGNFRCSREVADQKSVKAAVREFAADPAGAAKAYGTLVGACCFCGIALTDGAPGLGGSRDYGYGPTCAKNYGLPYKAYGKAQTGAMAADGRVVATYDNGAPFEPENQAAFERMSAEVADDFNDEIGF